MSTIRRLFQFIILTLLLLSCAPPETELSGQVFVVTRSRMNIKLGLVSIKAISASTLDSHILSTYKKTQAELDTLQKDIADVGISIEEREAVFQQTIQDEAVEQIERFLASGQREARASSASDQIRRELETLIQRRKTLQNRTERTEKDIWSLNHYWASLPTAPQEAKSDADGLFAMKVRAKTPLVIVAEASREIIASKEPEVYYWIVPVESGTTGKAHILLSNDNMITHEAFRRKIESTVSKQKGSA